MTKINAVTWKDYHREALEYGLPQGGKADQYLKRLESEIKTLKAENAKLVELLGTAKDYLERMMR